jgi:hypothetical protein
MMESLTTSMAFVWWKIACQKDMPVEEADAMQGEGAVGWVQQHLHQPSVAIGEVPDVPVDVLQRLLLANAHIET